MERGPVLNSSSSFFPCCQQKKDRKNDSVSKLLWRMRTPSREKRGGENGERAEEAAVLTPALRCAGFGQ